MEVGFELPMAIIVISFDGGSRRFRAEIPLMPAVQIPQTTSLVLC